MQGNKNIRGFTENSPLSPPLAPPLSAIFCWKWSLIALLWWTVWITLLNRIQSARGKLH